VVDAVGVTVFTPTEGTSPMPSIVIDVASVVRQVNCTGSPAEITVGVAVSVAVGVGAVAVGAVSDGGGRGLFFLQPDTAVKATKRRADVKKTFRSFMGILLVSKKLSQCFGHSGLVSPRMPSSDSSTDKIIVHCAGYRLQPVPHSERRVPS
jgi:hypothetical protein